MENIENIKEYIYTEDLNECLNCDFVAEFYLQNDDDCVCPQCKSTDYYIKYRSE
jgi:Zn finger protein HypA/HybF involved in hydrogenase expression